MTRKRVYVAGPISGGPDHPNDSDTILLNVHAAIIAGQRLMRAGFAPMVPHLSHYWDKMFPGMNTWNDWLELDEAWIEKAELMLRLPGRSAGSDREVKLARKLGIPVYFDVDALLSDHEVDDVKAPIIGLTGLAFSGKDTVGAILGHHGYERRAFADPLKNIATAIGWDGSKTVLPRCELCGMRQGRELLQVLGTEGVRENIRDDAWILAFKDSLKPDSKYVVTDVRFPNEAQAIHDMGGVIIRIERNQDTGVGTEHPSESNVDTIDADYVIHNNGTLEALDYVVGNLMNVITGQSDG